MYYGRRSKKTDYVACRFNDLLRVVGGQNCKNIDIDHLGVSDGYISEIYMGIENGRGKLEYFYLLEQTHGAGADGKATRKPISNQDWCSSFVAQRDYANYLKIPAFHILYWLDKDEPMMTYWMAMNSYGFDKLNSFCKKTGRDHTGKGVWVTPRETSQMCHWMRKLIWNPEELVDPNMLDTFGFAPGTKLKDLPHEPGTIYELPNLSNWT